MESLAKVFGRRVRSLREAKKWTQDDLGKAAGLGPKHIGVIERGEKTSSFDAVEKIAKAFGVQYYELFIPMHMRTGMIDKEISDLVTNASRIDVSNVDEFLRSLRAILRKLDKRQKKQ